MKRAIPAMALAIGALWTAQLAAQGRNFAGTWTFDSEKTAAAASTGAIGERRMAVGGGGGGRGGAVVAGGGDTGATAVARGGGGGGAAGTVAAVGAGGRGGGGGGMRSGPAAPMTIAMDATSVTIGTGATPTTYKVDGSTTKITAPSGIEVVAKASWKGDRLVIESTIQGADGPVTSTATWYLEGESLVRETTRQMPDGPVVQKQYYKKG